MELIELISKSETYNKFIESQKKLSGSILLLSDDDKILSDMAKYLAMGVVCKEKIPCMECSMCKKILSQNAIDVLSYPKSKNNISVDDIKDILDTVYLRPFDFDKKIYILNRIDPYTRAIHPYFL